MKRLISMTAAAGLLAGALLLPAVLRAEDKAKADDKPEAHEWGDREAKWREKLGITEEQAGKLKTLKRAHREAEEGSRSEMKATMRKLQDQLDDKASEKELSATLDKLQALHKKASEEREKFMGSMAQVLTPTQRARMAVAMSRGMGGGRMHGRGGKMGGRSHGGHEGGHGRDEDGDDD